MRALTVLIVLLCSACVIQPLPPPYPPAAIPQAAPPQAAASAQACREFDTPVTINGQEQEAHGTACLQPDGTWRVEQDVAGQAPQTYVIQPPVYQPYYPSAYLVDPWFYGPPLFSSGIFIGGGWGFRHHHGGWHGAWRGGRFHR
jgi:hypothetical protein